MDFASVPFWHGKETGTRLFPYQFNIIPHLFFRVKHLQKKKRILLKKIRKNIKFMLALYNRPDRWYNGYITYKKAARHLGDLA